MSPAPITLFVYNRLSHTKQTINALKKNKLAEQSKLIIFSDGFKNSDDEKKVNQVREYIRSIKGFNSVEIIERPDNFGLANSIVDGVTRLVNQYSKVIVLEDDIVTSPFFLEYMNNALVCFQDDPRVISIHGYNYPISGLPEIFFIKGADCWGWATWKTGWDYFEADGAKLWAEIKRRKLTNRFDFFGAYPYSRMLRKQIAGKNNSWAIRWYASAFLADKLTLYPGKSLVKNIGCDDTGEHCNQTGIYDTEISNVKVSVKKIPCIENRDALNKMSIWLRQSRPDLKQRIIRKIFCK
jgi:hypothetical protein